MLNATGRPAAPKEGRDTVAPPRDFKPSGKSLLYVGKQPAPTLLLVKALRLARGGGCEGGAVLSVSIRSVSLSEARWVTHPLAAPPRGRRLVPQEGHQLAGLYRLWIERVPHMDRGVARRDKEAPLVFWGHALRHFVPKKTSGVLARAPKSQVPWPGSTSKIF